VPLQTAEQGVFPAAVLLLCALCFQRVLSVLSFRHRSVEVRVQGDATVLLQDGRLLMDSLRASRITAQRIFFELRAQNVQHLGELRRVYLESTGDISILRYTHPHPGLPLIRTNRPAVSDLGARSLACSRCGYVACSSTETPPAHCEFCKCTEWIMVADPDQPGRTKA
jgi:hypothetical protein